MEKYKHTVHYYETDRMGFTHHSNYIRWMEEARIDFFDQLGWSYQKFEDEGVISPVTAIECKYKQTTTFPEEVYISVTVEGFRGLKLKLNYTMTNAAGNIVCEASSEHCFLGKDGGFIRIKKEYPEDIRVKRIVVLLVADTFSQAGCSFHQHHQEEFGTERHFQKIYVHNSRSKHCAALAL